jgi:esterase/lipase
MVIINGEINQGILSERIILGGFSMGGAMAYFMVNNFNIFEVKSQKIQSNSEIPIST